MQRLFADMSPDTTVPDLVSRAEAFAPPKESAILRDELRQRRSKMGTGGGGAANKRRKMANRGAHIFKSQSWSATLACSFPAVSSILDSPERL